MITHSAVDSHGLYEPHCLATQTKVSSEWESDASFILTTFITLTAAIFAFIEMSQDFDYNLTGHTCKLIYELLTHQFKCYVFTDSP